MTTRSQLAAAVAVLLLVGGCSQSTPRRPMFTVPTTIPSDCTRPVEGQIMAFLASVPNGSTVRFPARACYGQDRTIVLQDRRDLTIDGNGATFKRITPPHRPGDPNGNNANWRINRGTGNTLENLVIVGNYVPVTRGTPGQGQYTDHGVSIWGAENASVVNVQVSDVDGEFVAVDPDVQGAPGGDYTKAAPSRNILIDHLTGTGASRQCVSSTDVDGLIVRHSNLDNCQQTGFDAEIDVAGELNRNIHFVDNTITNAYFAPISIPVLSFPTAPGTVGNIEIRGNTVPHHPDTCFADVYVGSHPNTTASGVTIADNHFATIGDGVTITGSDVQATISGNAITYEGNHACDNPTFTPPYSAPVRRNGNAGVAVTSDNTFTGFCCNQDQAPPTTTPSTAPAVKP
jgi:hypothetical protein